MLGSLKLPPAHASETQPLWNAADERTVAKGEIEHAVRAEEHGAEVVDAEGLGECEDVLLGRVRDVGVVGRHAVLGDDGDMVGSAGAVHAGGVQTAAAPVTVAVARDGIAGPRCPRGVVDEEAAVGLVQVSHAEAEAEAECAQHSWDGTRVQ